MSNLEHSPNLTRINWIDQAKGIGIILVVMGHVLRGLLSSPGDYTVSTLKFFDSWIYSFHMPLFFFLSGLFAPRTLKQSPSNFFLNKLRTILYPYLIWSAILGLLRVVSGASRKSFHEFILSFWQVIYQPTDIFWFLYVLFLIAATYYLFNRARIANTIILIFSVCIAIFTSFHPTPFLWSPLNRLMIYSAYFIAAASVSRFMLQLDYTHRTRQYLFMTIASLAIITVSSGTGILRTPSPNLLIAAVGITGVISLSCLSVRLPQTQFIQTFGTYSLQIYVAHTIIGALVRTGLFKVLKINDFWIHFSLETLAGLYIPIVLAVVSLKIFPYLFCIPKKQASA